MNYKTINSTFDNFILNIKEYFSNKDNEIIFNQRNIIKLIDYNNKRYAVKSFKVPHLLNKIIYRFFRDSKAKRSFNNSIKLLDLKVNTPQPIGYVEYNSFLFFKESYYVSEFFDYDFEIKVVFNDKNFKDRDYIFEQFAKFTYELHEKSICHIDYSPGNILIKKINDKYQFFIIDVNRMKFIDFDLDLRMKNISKLITDEKDEIMLIKFYAQISNFDIDILFEKYIYYKEEQQKYLANKKKLKQLIKQNKKS